MTVESKMSTKNIFRSFLNEVRMWNDGDKDIPHRVKKPFSSLPVWLTSGGVPITYELFEYMIKDELQFTQQIRLIKETWNYLVRQNYIIKKEINQHSNTFTINLVEVRYILGIDGAKEMEINFPTKAADRIEKVVITEVTT